MYERFKVISRTIYLTRFLFYLLFLLLFSYTIIFYGKLRLSSYSSHNLFTTTAIDVSRVAPTTLRLATSFPPPTNTQSHLPNPQPSHPTIPIKIRIFTLITASCLEVVVIDHLQQDIHYTMLGMKTIPITTVRVTYL